MLLYKTRHLSVTSKFGETVTIEHTLVGPMLAKFNTLAYQAYVVSKHQVDVWLPSVGFHEKTLLKEQVRDAADPSTHDRDAADSSTHDEMVAKNAILGNKNRQVKIIRLIFPQGIDPRYYTDSEDEPSLLQYKVDTSERVQTTIIVDNKKREGIVSKIKIIWKVALLVKPRSIAETLAEALDEWLRVHQAA